jgi:hypothetical protein
MVWTVAAGVHAQADDASASATPPLAPSEVPDDHAWGANRDIGKHSFQFPVFVPSALVLSYLGQRTGFQSLQIPDVVFRSRKSELKQARIEEDIDAGVRIVDRVGLFASLYASGSSSVNRFSMIVRGGNYRLGARGGVIVKLFRLDETNTQVSLRARIAGESGQIVTLLPLLQALDQRPVRSAVDAVTGELGDVLLAPFSSFEWGGDLVVAQPLGRAFSAQAFFGLTFNSTTLRPYDLVENMRHDRDLSITTPQFGLALTADGIELKVPLALVFEYVLAAPDAEESGTNLAVADTTHVFALSLNYTGRRDLQAGITAFGQFGNESLDQITSDGTTRKSGTARRAGAVLTLRYIW